MAETEDPGVERRRWPRVTLAAHVTLSSSSVADLVQGPLHDISLGGLFLRSLVVRPVGTQVSLHVVVPAEHLELNADGVVVRVVSPDEAAASGRPSGMGIEFTSLDDAARATLARLLGAGHA
jgi:uncharacterized protein (TIGR02266 family)